MSQIDAGCTVRSTSTGVAGASAGEAGSWMLVTLLGQGRFTRVFAARPVEGGNGAAPYAVKVLNDEHEEDAEALCCLRRESCVGRTVSHPHLVSVLSAQLRAPPYFLVMPRLFGLRLSDLASRHSFSLTMALCVIRQVAQALDALHVAGWTHADVKPGNIIVSPNGHATLLDLGFARRRGETGGSCRALQGTPAYLAPEAFISAWAPDIRSDLYSVGVMLYELLACRRPFLEQDPASLARCHLSAPPPDLRRLTPQVPVEVAWLVGELLAKEPLRRPQTPKELIDRLVPLEIMTLTDRNPVWGLSCQCIARPATRRSTLSSPQEMVP